MEETRVRNAIDEGGFEGKDVSDELGDRCGQSWKGRRQSQVRQQVAVVKSLHHYRQGDHLHQQWLRCGQQCQLLRLVEQCCHSCHIFQL